MIFNKKHDNTKYLLKVNKIKRYTYPTILFIKRLGLLNLINPTLKILSRFLKISNVPQFTTNEVVKIFNKKFNKNTEYKRTVLFIFMLGIERSSHFIKQITLAKYFEDNNIHPIFLVCDAFLPICDKERIYKDRTTTPLFCDTCYKGFEDIEKKTGLDVKYMSKYFDTDLQKEFEHEKLEINKITSIEECINYRYKDEPLGALTRNSIFRHLEKGTLNQNDIVLYKMRLISSLKFYLTLKNFLIKNTIDKIILWNGVLQFDAIARHLANIVGIDYITQENHVYTNNSWIYNKNNIAVYLKWDNEWKAFKENHELTPVERKEAGEMFSKIISGSKFGKKFRGSELFENEENNFEYVGLFTNVGFDTYVIGRNPVFNSMSDWLEATLLYWRSNPHANKKLIIRAHPAEIKAKIPTQEFVYDIVKNYLDDDIIFFDADINIDSYSIMKKIKYGLVYASSIGFEMVLNKIPCLVAGNTYYDEFVFKPNRREHYFELLKEMENGIQLNNDDEIILKFIYFLFIHKVSVFRGIDYNVNKQIIFETNNVNELVELNRHTLSNINKLLFN